MTPDPYLLSLIAEVDKTIDMVRPFWLEARDEGEKRKSLNRINELLDQRLALMAKRDGAQTPVPNVPL